MVWAGLAFFNREAAIVRTLLALALVALLVAPVSAIDFNSTIADWDAAGLLRTDQITHRGGDAYMLAWGVTIQDGKLFAVMQNDETLSSAFQPFFGVSINADVLPTELDGMLAYADDTFAGTDIHIEWGPNNEHFNLWGGGPIIDAERGNGTNPGYHDYTARTEYVNGGEGAKGAAKYLSTDLTDDTVSIWFDVAELSAKTAEFNQLAEGGNGVTWPIDNGVRAGVRLAVFGTDWNSNGAADTAPNVIPEPGAIAMLIGAAMALAGLALRRRS